MSAVIIGILAAVAGIIVGVFFGGAAGSRKRVDLEAQNYYQRGLIQAEKQRADKAMYFLAAAKRDALYFGGCNACKYSPQNGGDCPGTVDCGSEDGPLDGYYQKAWRGEQ